MSKPNQRLNQSLLVRLLIVLSITVTLLVLAAIMVFLPGVRDRNDSNIEVAHLVTIKENIERIFMTTEGSYEGMNMALANRAGVFPSTMNHGDRTATANARSAWGGRVYLREIPAGSPQRFYLLEYHEAKPIDCLGFVSGVFTYLDQIQVNGTPLFTDERGAEMGASKGGFFNPSEAAKACASKDLSLILLTVE